ncbi:MAG TPA: DUF4349 domain-containing protein [Dehalococcoidia bacterium]|jgi:uncharacterized protein YjeT (DUF2065 family)
MRTKTAILSSGLLLGALAAAAIGAATLLGGHGGSATIEPAASGGDRAAKTVNGPAAPAAADSSALGLPAPAGSGGTTGSNTTANGSASISSSLVDRKIERQATLDITVDDVAGTVSRIEAAAGDAGGFISQETITQATTSGPNDVKRQQATVQIRVPAEKYTAVMNDLRGLAKEVTSENSQTSEVTGQYTDLQSQLRNLQSTEQQYLTLMGTATTVGDILTVQDRLNSVQGQIEQVQGQIQLLDNLTAMATITIDVSLPLLPATTEPPQTWAAQAWANAWDTSQQVLRGLGTGAITAGVVFVWVLIPGMAALGAWRLFGTRRNRGEVPSA